MSNRNAVKTLQFDLNRERNVSKGKGKDTSAPSAPSGLVAVATSHSTAALSWQASTDNRGVEGYQVFRGDVLVGWVTTGTSYIDSGLVGSTSYSYQVAAYDKAGNLSADSNTATITTSVAPVPPPTPEPPAAPTNLAAVALSDAAIKLTWAAPTNATGVVGYRVLRNGSLVARPDTSPYTDAGLSASTAYSYVVQSYNNAGQISASSNTAVATTLQTPVVGFTFAQQLNPTGNPMGGGPGYNRIIDPATANYVVGTKAALLSALAAATSGQVIYVSDGATIDLTGEVASASNAGIVIKGGVTLASGRGRGGSLGALIKSDDQWTNETLLQTLFKTGGANVRMTGLRLQGPNAFGADHRYTETGVSMGVRSFHAGLEVDNCEIYAWDRFGVWLYIGALAKIHHNHIHHNNREGFGYGIWHGGSGSATGELAIFEGNLMHHNRHSIASSGHPNSWEARHNVVLNHDREQKIDRHEYQNGEGGINTTLRHNLIFADSNEHVWRICPPITARGGKLQIHDNWWGTAVAYGGSYRSGTYTLPQRVGQDVIIRDNRPTSEARLPVVTLNASVLSGVVPLTVNFTASAVDPDGHAISQYLWHFGDGANHYGNGLSARGATRSYQFTEAGVYNVEVMALNSYGVPGFATRQITVLPADTGYWLSAWVRDSYHGALTGYYQKQIRVGNTVVWSDDVAGNEGWQHVLVDITSHVGGAGSSARIAFRLACTGDVSSPLSTITYARLYVDDVAILGGTNIANPGFEVSGNWLTAQSGSPSWSFLSRNTADARSGASAFRISSGNSGAVRTAGQYGEIYQNVTLGQPL